MRILLTGATGFIGSHLADFLFSKGYDLLLTKRTTSAMTKCSAFMNNVQWINTDEFNWVQIAVDFKPDIIIHGAWNGVENSKRDDWEAQLSNIDFLYKILKVSNLSNANKIICLGSQAEYGRFDEKVTEEYKVAPVSSYGVTKLANLELLKSFCEDHQKQWYWLRIFSVIGEHDNANWLLPTVISKLEKNESIELTLGEQMYDYIYVQDLNDRILKIIEIKENKSGIYNICSGRATQIKELLCLIADNLSKSTTLLKFGALPYRNNQTMYMVGDSTKFESFFGKCSLKSVDEIIRLILNQGK